MRLALLGFSLLLTSILFCFSNAAPPSRGNKYSYEEEDLIAKQLEYYASTYDENTWKLIQTAHAQKLAKKANGFLTERTRKALRKHFIDVIIKGKGLIEVSDTLKQLYHQKILRGYSTEERKVINRELLSYEVHHLYSDDTWTKIAQKLKENRQVCVPGYDTTKTGNAVRLYFLKVMIPNNFVDEAVKQKFPDHFNPDGCNKLKMPRYSPQENELILEVLKEYPDLEKCIIINKIVKAHRNKVQAKETGFTKLRSTNSLRKRVELIVKRNDHLPEAVKQTFLNPFKIQEGSTSHVGENLSGPDGSGDRECVEDDEDRVWECVADDEDRVWEYVEDDEDRVWVRKGRTKKKYSKKIDQEEDPILEDLETSQVDEFGVDHSLFQDSRRGDDNNIFMDEEPYNYRTFEPITP